jgi:hypothetical protein
LTRGGADIDLHALVGNLHFAFLSADAMKHSGARGYLIDVARCHGQSTAAFINTLSTTTGRLRSQSAEADHRAVRR